MQPIIIHCIAGAKRCSKEGVFASTLFGDIPVSYSPHGICNVISFRTMKRLYHITYESNPNDREIAAFEIHTPFGIVKFRLCDLGLHYLDLSEGNNSEILCSQLVPMVRENFEGYSKSDVIGAIKARNLQSMIGGVAQADYKGMVHEKMIADCPVDNNNLKNAHTIFGPDLAGL